MSYDRDPRPPHVHQSNQQHCWAATFDSFSAVEPRMHGHVHQADLLAAPWTYPFLNAQGGIDMNQGWVHLTGHFPGLQRQTLTPDHVTAQMFEAALRMSYVVVGYVVVWGSASHIVLAYGVTDIDLKIMDPFRGYIRVSFSEVRQSPLKVAFFGP